MTSPTSPRSRSTTRNSSGHTASSASSSSASLLSLIRQAQRQLAYMRAARANYATPSKWAAHQRQQISHTLHGRGDLGAVNRDHTTLAARWAVADARRKDNPELARRLDRRVLDTGISEADLRAARWQGVDDGYRGAHHQQSDRPVDPSTPSALTASGIPLAAGLVVAACLYDNAADWDESSAEQVEHADAQWSDPVPVPEYRSSNDPVSGIFDPEAVLPSGLHAASIDEQIANVIAGEGGPTPAGGPGQALASGTAIAPSPEVGM